MKKISLLVISLAFGMSFSFAQPTINAITPGQTNISNINQSGKDQVADVTQLGTFNTSKLTQAYQGNDAKVTQNNSYGKDVPTYSEISQTGADNSAIVEQISNNTNGVGDFGQMTALINQSGNSNTAIQLQGPHDKQGFVWASIDQQGFGNFASQNQAKYGNEATIVQTGDQNSAKQAQDAELVNEDYEGSYNIAKINQSGFGNDASQTQMGSMNTAEIVQPGDLNVAVQNQAYYSAENNAFIIQDGDFNEAYQDQVGSYNHATIYQHSSNNKACQDQHSEAPEAGNQTLVDGQVVTNKATILQENDCSNQAFQTQFYLSGRSAACNEELAIQTGKENHSSQFQYGNSMYSLVQQIGCGNCAEVCQSLAVPR